MIGAVFLPAWDDKLGAGAGGRQLDGAGPPGGGIRASTLPARWPHFLCWRALVPAASSAARRPLKMLLAGSVWRGLVLGCIRSIPTQCTWVNQPIGCHAPGSSSSAGALL